MKSCFKDSVIMTAGLSLYTINRIIKDRLTLPVLGIFFRNHFNDYLGTIVFAAYINILFVIAGQPSRQLKSLKSLLILGCICSLAWEGIAPIFLPYSTADWLDCIAYLAGAATYWAISKKGENFKR